MATNMDPWGGYYFSLELDGNEVAHFSECSGLKSSAQVFEIEEGGLNGITHRLVGQSKWENIVLKFATSVSIALVEWRDKYLQDQFTKRPETSGSIVMRSNTGEELRRFNFVGAFPVSWEGPSLSSGGSDLAIETLEIAHEGIYVDGAEPSPPDPLPEPEDPEDPEDIDIDPDDDQIHTPPVQFEYDSSELTDDGKKVVDDVAEALNNHPEITHVWVEGHTCTMGSWDYNLGLSDDRSTTVADALQEQTDKKQFHPKGYSWKYPVAANKSKSGREANRRTEFFTSSPETRGRSTKRPPKKPS